MRLFPKPPTDVCCIFKLKLSSQSVFSYGVPMEVTEFQSLGIFTKNMKLKIFFRPFTHMFRYKGLD